VTFQLLKPTQVY